LNFIKKFAKISAWLLGSILSLTLLLYFLFRLPSVQTWIAQRAASYLSSQLNTNIKLKGLDIVFFKTIVLEGLLIEDQKQDTLLYTDRLAINIGPVILEKNKFTINSINLNKPTFHLKTYKGEKQMNLQFLLDYFSSPPDTSTPEGLPLDLKIKSFKLQEADFIYSDENIPNEVPNVIDYDHLHVRKLTADIKSFSLWHGEIRAEILSLALKEKSGFEIEKLAGKLKFTDTEIEIANLLLLTPHSNIHDYYSMRFDSLSDFNDYINNVRMYADFDQSIISFKDIRYFASAISNYTQMIMLNGKISGTVANLKSNNFQLHTGEKTFVDGAISIKGLPDIYHTDFNAKLQKLETNYKDLTDLLKGIDQDSVASSIPEFLKNAGDISYAGYYTGTVFNFNVNGQANTSIGNLVTAIHMNILPKVPTYDGKIQTIGFDFGKLFNTNSVGTANLDIVVNGKGFNIKDLNTSIETDIRSIVANGYAYKNIVGEGDIASKKFNGNVVIDDEHVDLSFNGSIDFDDPKNPVFDFYADVQNLELKELKISEDTLNIKSIINVNFIGNSIDNIIGTLVFKESTIESKNNAKYTFENISIDSKFDGMGKSLTLKSDIIDAGIQGEYKLSSISSAVKSVVKRYLPSYDLGVINKYASQDFKFYIIVDDAKPLTDLIYPALSIANKASLRGYLNTNDNILRMNSGIDFIKYDNLRFENLILDGENDKDVFDFNIASTRGYIGDSINIDNIAISNSVKNDSIHFNIKLADKDSPNQLDLNGLLSIKREEPLLQFLPSEILIDSNVWSLKDSFEILFAKDKKIYVSNFEISNNDQRLISSGVLSDNFSDEFIVDFQNVRLYSFNQILKKYNINVDGTLNARTKLNGILGESVILSNINISDMIYNKDSVGDLQFNSTWDPKSELINVNGSIFNKRLKTFGVAGSISTKKSTNNLNIDVVMNETELQVIEPFVKDYISNISGKASADLKIRGSLNEPAINGYLTLKSAGLTVNYLKTQFKISDQIRLSENNIYINNIQLKDSEGNKGSANGVITHTYFSKFKLDIKMQAKNLICLNTGPKDNELYYGKAHATGQFLFRGPIEDLKIDIDAKTERGTKFYIPLSDAGAISKQNYIRFISKDSTDIKKNDYSISMSGISMNMNLQVDEESEVQLIMNQASGEIIKGTGNANLKLAINTLGTFEMYGTYEIAAGEYTFVLQNLISKKFKVDKGGTIRWNGDPLKAKINLSAVYETRPQVLPLIISASPGDTSSYSSSQRVKTECVLNMKNDLMSPDISFGMRFPDDQSLSSKVGGYLANPDNMNNQVASLLVFGRFSNTSSSSGSFIPTTDILTAQLSNLVSTKNFDLNLANGVGGSLRLFNDRITIDGTINTANNSTSTTNQQTNASAITGDVNIDYKISKDGRFRAKAFQRNDNNSDLLKRGNNQVEQGLGLFYRIEFDTFGELWRKIFNKEEEKAN
jgi:hypothetical protein